MTRVYCKPPPLPLPPSQHHSRNVKMSDGWVDFDLLLGNFLLFFPF